jgi:hypothetical protein
MRKTKVTVNGTEYDHVVEDPHGRVHLSSSKHPDKFITSLEELQTQYGVKTAYFVKMALGGRREKEALSSSV